MSLIYFGLNQKDKVISMVPVKAKHYSIVHIGLNREVPFIFGYFRDKKGQSLR